VTDPAERLRALTRPYQACTVPDRAVLARRATVRNLRHGTVSGSALAGVVAFAVALSGPGTSRSLVTVTPAAQPPTAAAPAPVETHVSASAGPGTRSDGVDDPLVGVGLPNGDRVEVTAGPPPGVVVKPSSPAPTTPPPSPPSTAPAPVWWQGTYGASPFFGRQVVDDAAEADDCGRDATLGVIPGNGTCYGAELQGAVSQGGPFIGEVKACAATDNVSAQNVNPPDPETEFVIYDETAKQTVRTWREPAGYDAAPYTLDPGDCAFYLWHLPLVDDAGNPIPSGHRYHLRFVHDGVLELTTPTATAP
jgi:hypothetical protein